MKFITAIGVDDTIFCENWRTPWYHYNYSFPFYINKIVFFCSIKSLFYLIQQFFLFFSAGNETFWWTKVDRFARSEWVQYHSINGDDNLFFFELTFSWHRALKIIRTSWNIHSFISIFEYLQIYCLYHLSKGLKITSTRPFCSEKCVRIFLDILGNCFHRGKLWCAYENLPSISIYSYFLTCLSNDIIYASYCLPKVYELALMFVLHESTSVCHFFKQSLARRTALNNAKLLLSRLQKHTCMHVTLPKPN